MQKKKSEACNTTKQPTHAHLTLPETLIYNGFITKILKNLRITESKKNLRPLFLPFLTGTAQILIPGKYSAYRGAYKSLARSGRKQARKHAKDARDFNDIETRAVIKFFFFLQGKAPKKIRDILTETLVCFIPGRAKDLSAPQF